MAKMMVDLHRGLIEIEGDEKLVERVYSDLKEITLEKLSHGTFEVGREAGKDLMEDEITAPKKPRRKGKAGGPSCASRIEAIKSDGFFKDARSTAEVRDKLRERGSTYASKNVAAALTNLIKAGKLRRFDDGGWKYQNP